MHASLYHDNSKFEGGDAAFKWNLNLKYEGRKFGVGLSMLTQSSRMWSLVENESFAPLAMLRPIDAGLMSDQPQITNYEVPFSIDVKLLLDWKISKTIALWMEGENLANCRRYIYPLYRDSSVGFTVGVKMNF